MKGITIWRSGKRMEILPLNKKKWEEFRIEKLFNVSRPSARNKDAYEGGGVPFVASGSVNNGVLGLCRPHDGEALDSGNCITVSPVDGSTFYQPADFLGRGGAGSSIIILRREGLNPYSGQFIARAIKQTCSKYTYGHMGNQISIKRERIMLPVNELNEPDYEYMSEYVARIREEMLDRYRAYVSERITELGEHREIPALDEKEWANFELPHIFGFIQRGKRLKNADHVPGNIPYVSSTAANNGVDDYVEASHGTRVFGDCISLANSGSVGTAFYEPFEYAASDHVTALKRDGLSRYCYLFMIAAIEKQGSNFNFNREINDARVRKMQIMLPIDDTGEPDYEYMEQYARNMALRKYRQYLKFLDEHHTD